MAATQLLEEHGGLVDSFVPSGSSPPYARLSSPLSWADDSVRSRGGGVGEVATPVTATETFTPDAWAFGGTGQDADLRTPMPRGAGSRLADAGELTPADCLAALRHTLQVGGHELWTAATEAAAAACPSTSAAQHLASGRGGLWEGASFEQNTETLQESDALWAEVLAQQAARLTDLARENAALRARADLSARMARCSGSTGGSSSGSTRVAGVAAAAAGRSTRDSARGGGSTSRPEVLELSCLAAAQRELIASLSEGAVVSAPSAPTVAAATGARQRADGCGDRARIAQLAEQAALRLRFSPAHAEALALLEAEDGPCGAAGSAGAARWALRWHGVVERDPASAVEALLVERDRLRATAPPPQSERAL
eukprot:CAMPEP_0177208816 /NCGR_PEP_ID=MMETSP0367-20130122/30691_1 /TAXON_ID=447022 ORGANISM="Scrippsiella hangoei-like, Strain SHHI-4" /NCGR_SAMPLE_ID=MMETSP0367 /ASSEMBLY_ACC=CAM_ASM_000362 /LENGTH=368 /DNA_ID=CAMNT_0018657821 /DNA_START=1 /DNA_END=1104 /DNA_ORIENTATION=+